MNWPKTALLAALLSWFPGHSPAQTAGSSATPAVAATPPSIWVAPTPAPAVAADAAPGSTPSPPFVPSISGSPNHPQPMNAAPPGPTPIATPTATPPPGIAVKIDLSEQETYLMKDNVVILKSPISSGRPGHLTRDGSFNVIQKDLNHKSNLYGKFVDKKTGDVVKSGADAAMPVPKGCEFLEAPMKFFMRFDGATGMHAGVLPGYAASHGCIRMPASKAEAFYNAVGVGTPVTVVGTAPIHEEESSHARARAIPIPTPTPPPKKHGWWIFHGKN